MDRLLRLGGGMPGLGQGPPTDAPAVDTAEQVYISSLALLKMLKHGRAGVPMEVMGLMLGEFVDDYTVRVIDVFAMPQSGTIYTWSLGTAKSKNVHLKWIVSCNVFLIFDIRYPASAAMEKCVQRAMCIDAVDSMFLEGLRFADVIMEGMLASVLFFRECYCFEKYGVLHYFIREYVFFVDTDYPEDLV